jgi:hypothetical protein
MKPDKDMCVATQTLAPIKLVFSKLHKVGSTSLKEAFVTLIEPPTSWWKCAFDPYSHEFMNEVRGHRIDHILPKCIKKDNQSGGVMLPVERVILLRDPMERLISVWLYTLGNFIFGMRKYSESVKNENGVVASKIFNMTTLSITKKEIAHFISVNKFHTSYVQFFAGPRSKKTHFGNKKNKKKKKMKPLVHSSNDTQADLSSLQDSVLLPHAIKVLEDDYTLFATTETLPSFFVYLSCRFGLNVSATCDKFITRSVTRRNMQYFRNITRPAPEALFNAETLAYLAEYIQPDKLLWLQAQTKHEKQLAEYGYTIKTATEVWRRHCGESFLKRNASDVKTVMT